MKSFDEEVAEVSVSDEIIELLSYYKKLKDELPFHLNILDEIHANENAHTRILTRLLEYETDGRRTLLLSFLSLLRDFNEQEKDINEATVTCGKDYIYCKVVNRGKFAVIIENKIHGANDQDKQIERYVDTVREDDSVPQGKIWVIYLTRDGEKEVADVSLTDKVKEILQDRFLPKNYREDVLPWLKNNVLPNCKIKEEWLITALKQYIDYLEGLFGLRQSQNKLMNKMETKLNELLRLADDMMVSEKYSAINEFNKKINELSSKLDTLLSKVRYAFAKTLGEQSEKVFHEILPGYRIKVNEDALVNQLKYNYCKILVDDWPECLHFEWYSFDPMNSEGDIYFVVQVENDTLKTNINKQLGGQEFKKKAEELGFCRIGKRTTTYYQQKSDASTAIADLSGDRLFMFLKEMYKDVPDLIEFINKILSKFSYEECKIVHVDNQESGLPIVIYKSK